MIRRVGHVAMLLLLLPNAHAVAQGVASSGIRGSVHAEGTDGARVASGVHVQATDSATIKDTIAEGCGAATNKEFARFLDMSIKSANETEGHLLSARGLDLFSLDEWQKYTAETIEIRKMVYGYRKKLMESGDDS